MRLEGLSMLLMRQLRTGNALIWKCRFGVTSSIDLSLIWWPSRTVPSHSLASVLLLSKENKREIPAVTTSRLQPTKPLLLLQPIVHVVRQLDQRTSRLQITSWGNDAPTHTILVEHPANLAVETQTPLPRVVLGEPTCHKKLAVPLE